MCVLLSRGNRLRTELYIDSGDGAGNLEVFETLKAGADAIETELDVEGEWEDLARSVLAESSFTEMARSWAMVRSRPITELGASTLCCASS